MSVQHRPPAQDSLIVQRAPGSHSLHLPWVRATRPLVAHLDLSELFALVPVHGDTADFLTPPPSSPLPDFGGELESVRATSPGRVAAELAGVPGLPAGVAGRIRARPARGYRLARWAPDRRRPARPLRLAGRRGLLLVPTVMTWPSGCK
jgi:hypothetical protein